jgi:hypothetical protein
MKTIRDNRLHTWGEKVRTMFSKPENNQKWLSIPTLFNAVLY